MKKYPFLMILLLLASVTTARSAKTNTAYSFALSGICKDSSAKETPAELLFRVFDFYSSSGFNTNASIKINRLLFGQIFHNNFTLPASKSFITIINQSPKMGLTMFRIDNAYLVEDGDDLYCEIFRDSIWFSGKGSEKMNIQAQLFMIADKNFKVDKSLSQLKERLDKIYREQIDYLNYNRSKINQEIYDYLSYQCYGYRAKALIRQIDYEKNYNKKNYSVEARDILTGLDKTDSKILKEDAHLSDAFTDYLYKKIKFDYYLNWPLGQDVSPIIKMITQHYSGKVRDRLYLIAFSDLSKGRFKDVFSNIDEAIGNSTYRPYQELLIKYKTSLASAQPAYQFELPDSTGQMIKLSDFKDKVIVMDFWFTGCIPCMALAEEMKQIIPRFKDNEVVFITINVDSQKDIWKSSLRSGKYTDPYNINLFANAEGRKAPILNHYNISTYPKLIIIGKNQKIVTSTPLKPTKELITHHQFIALIESAL